MKKCINCKGTGIVYSHLYDYGTHRTKLEHVLKYFSNHKKEMKTEKQWIECALEEATGLRNSEGMVMPGGFCCNLGHLRTDDGNYWTSRQVQFAKLTPVKEVQVEVLPEWVTDRSMAYFADPTAHFKSISADINAKKEQLYRRGLIGYPTEEEAIAAADAQIARNLAERDGEIVKVQKWFGSAVIDVVRIAHDQFASKCVEITIREVKDL
jgi:hypothetical protein